MRTVAGLLVGTWLMCGLSACGSRDSILSPDAGVRDGAPEPRYRTPIDAAGVIPNVTLETDWSVVGSQLVLPGDKCVVTGSRYALEFGVSSLKSPLLITISERDSTVADVEFGPDGTRFDEPVTVTIDYRGTAVDPESDNYRGATAGAFFYNPEMNRWEPLPCVVDTEARTVTFKVSHFSRYGLTDAALAGEWQWNRNGRPGDRIHQGGRR